jgi:hypothetical protein
MRLLLLFFGLFFAACANDTPEPTATNTDVPPPPDHTIMVSSSFEANGIAFEVPNGWAMTDTLDAGGGYYVACERQGAGQSGMIAVTRVDDPKIKLEKMIQQRTPKGTPITKGLFKGYDAFMATCINEENGMEMTKTVYAFEACNAKYVFSCLSESQNAQQNQLDFQTIMDSWKCR